MPLPAFGCWDAIVYWNVFVVGTAVIVNVPL